MTGFNFTILLVFFVELFIHDKIKTIKRLIQCVYVLYHILLCLKIKFIIIIYGI